MGGAIVRGMISSGNYSASNIIAILPSDSPDIERVKSTLGIEVTSIEKMGKVDFLVLAVKPQVLPEVMPSLKLKNSTCVISIAAGKKLSYFKQLLPNNPIIRTMPNINATVGHSVTVACSAGNIIDSQKQECEKIFKSVGSFNFVDDENLMDAVTAISGSGPAYFFRFVELLTNAAVKSGLPEDVAKNISTNTFFGSAKLAENSDESLAKLRESVTSKGGTTEAALNSFNEGDALEKLIFKSVSAAIKRSKELSS